MTGLQVATGVEIATPNTSFSSFGDSDMERRMSSLSQPKKQKIQGNTQAALAFCAAIAGLVTTLVLKQRQQKYLVPAISGGVGTLLLLLIKSGTDDSIVKQGSGMIQVSYGLGFWLSLLLFLGAAGLNGYQFMEERKPRTPSE
jgi:hypothetical protein